MKIPVAELAFINGQREQIGFIGSHQNGLPDDAQICLSITDKSKSRSGRKTRRRLAEYNQKMKHYTSMPSKEIHFLMIKMKKVVDVQEGNGGSYELTVVRPSRADAFHARLIKRQYYTLELHNVATQSIMVAACMPQLPSPLLPL